jgi:hypothetical protein
MGVNPSRTLVVPSWELLKSTNFSTSSPSATTSGSRSIRASSQTFLPPQRLPPVCRLASPASRKGWKKSKASLFCRAW